MERVDGRVRGKSCSKRKSGNCIQSSAEDVSPAQPQPGPHDPGRTVDARQHKRQELERGAAVSLDRAAGHDGQGWGGEQERVQQGGVCGGESQGVSTHATVSKATHTAAAGRTPPGRPSRHSRLGRTKATGSAGTPPCAGPGTRPHTIRGRRLASWASRPSGSGAGRGSRHLPRWRG